MRVLTLVQKFPAVLLTMAMQPVGFSVPETLLTQGKLPPGGFLSEHRDKEKLRELMPGSQDCHP